MLRLEIEGNIDGEWCKCDGRICPVFAVTRFQKFDAPITVKLMYICHILCVESYYQNSFELVE